eukprot:Nk52_evm1s85 gene=Nk52_evmTU1s85
MKAITQKARTPHLYIQERLFNDFTTMPLDVIPKDRAVIISIDLPYELQREEWDQEKQDLPLIAEQVQKVFSDREGYAVIYGSWEQVHKLQTFLGGKICYGVKPQKKNTTTTMVNRMENFLLVPYAEVPFKDNVFEQQFPAPSEVIRDEFGKQVNPTQKGLKHMNSILQPLIKELQTKGHQPVIVDAYAGTGTNSVIAITNGLDFVVVEKNPTMRLHLIERLLAVMYENDRREEKVAKAALDKPARTDPPDKAPQQFKPNVYDNR